MISALTNSDNAAALGINAEKVGTTPDSVAAVLSGITNSDKLQKLAKIIASCKDSSNAIDLVKSGTSYSASSLDHGWYLVLDESTLGNGNDDVKVRSANILKFTGDTTINSKHSLPTLEKKIVEGGSEVDYNTASIGDTITYHINTKVPDTRGYEKYFFIVDDTFSTGLTFQSVSSIIVYDDKDDGDGNTEAKKTLALDTGDYTDTTGDYYVVSGDNTVKIVFENIIDRLGACTPGDDIVITYTAKLNSNAVITDAGNTNTAKLTYSNDPNVSATGKDVSHPDEPGGSAPPVGETPEDTVKTYTTAIKINKVDQSNDPLTGAKFTLSCTNNEMQYVTITSYSKFTEDSSGAYWKLADGTYTKTAPSGAADPLYDDTSKKYKKETGTSASVITEDATSTSYAVEAEVDDQGNIIFKGLKPGTYTLTESQVPTGYNGAAAETFKIVATPTSSSATWAIKNSDDTTNTKFSLDDSDNTYEITIQNRQGATLPTTGGIGTKLFYIIGGLLVAGSVVLLVTKKRMKTNED